LGGVQGGGQGVARNGGGGEMSEGGDRRNRGEGAMAGALARRSSSRAAPTAGTVSGVERTSGPVPVRRRRPRARVGKSKDPAYKLGSAYVLESIHDQVMAELLRPDVRALLIRQFGRFGVQYMPKKAAYSDLVELLLRRWLEGLEEELEEEA
jgi:hypothetical protein